MAVSDIDQTSGFSARAPVTNTAATAWPARTQGFFAFMAMVFVISLTIPVYFNLGGFRLNPYRSVLLLMFFPVFIGWLSGGAGPRLKADIYIILAWLWAAFTLIFHYGGQAAESSGIMLIEAWGAYFLGRMAIRNATDFRRILRLHLGILTVMVPFVWYENQTDISLLIRWASSLGSTLTDISTLPRLGMFRAQATFEHPILFGIFAATAIGGVRFILIDGRSAFAAIFFCFVAIYCAIGSVSTAAMGALMIQLWLFIYEGTTRSLKRRWLIFAIGVLAFYILIDILSNRSPFHVLVDYLTLNSGSGYSRILIWRYGTQNVAANPIFGIGLEDWVRPHWMGSSVDNFWLLIAMRHGLPAAIFLGLAMFFMIRHVSWAPLRSRHNTITRAGYLVALGGLLLASGTVHYWNTMFVWFMFFTGAGGFLIHTEGDADDTPEPDPRARRSGPTRRGQPETAGAAADPEDTPPPRPQSRYSRPPRNPQRR